MSGISLDPTGIGTIADAAVRIIGLFKASATAKQTGELQMDEARLDADIQGVLGQLQINIEEAKNPNWFVAGWRPFIGWSCGAGLAYGIVLKPVIWSLMVLFHSSANPTLLPTLDTGTIMGLLIPMLGLGVMRTFEKTQSAQNNH